MARYRKIEVAVWTDDVFQEMSSPPPNAQTLWIYLLTGPRTTQFPGLVVAREEVMASDLRWSLEGFREAFAEAFRKGLVKVDRKAGLVWLTKALIDSSGEPRSTSKPESPNVIRGWAKSWDEIPECQLKNDYLRELETFFMGIDKSSTKGGEAFAEAYREAFRKALTKASRHPSPNQEQDTGTGSGSGNTIAAAPLAPVRTAGILSPPLENITPPPAKPRKASEPKVEGYNSTIADFDARYAAAHSGSRPTWGQDTGANLKRLLRRHGEVEVRKRIAFLFDTPPSWLTGRDFGTLVKMFDKLVPSTNQQSLSKVGRVEPLKAGEYPDGELQI